MMAKRNVVGLLVLTLLFAVSGWAQETYWETVTTNSSAMNSGWMELSAGTRTNAFVAGLHQSGPLSAMYAWRTLDGGDTWQDMYEIEMDPSDPCSMNDLMGFILSTAFSNGEHGILTGMGVPEECKEQGMPLCMMCIFQMKARVLYTFDAGDTWGEAPMPGNSLFVGLVTATFVTDEVGFTAGPPAYLVKTTDGGFTWTQLEIPGGNEELGINQMHFIDPETGWMATGDLEPEEAAASGDTAMRRLARARAEQDFYGFREAMLDYLSYTRDPIARLNYRQSHGGRGKGLNAVVFHTTDGGISWEPQLSNSQESYFKVDFLNDQQGLLLADPLTGTAPTLYRIYYTKDGGETWDASEIPETIPGVGSTYLISDMALINENVGYAVGAAQAAMFYRTVILKTEDGGETWTVDPFTTEGQNARWPALAVDFVDPKYGFAVGMYLSAARYVGPNSIPIADAGEDQTVPVGTLVQLDGTGSYDPDGDPLTYIWSQPGGAPVTLDDSTSPTPSFTATEVGQLTFELLVTDGEANSEPDQVTITVVEEDDDDADDDSGIADDDTDEADDDDDDDDDGNGCGGCSMM